MKNKSHFAPLPRWKRAFRSGSGFGLFLILFLFGHQGIAQPTSTGAGAGSLGGVTCSYYGGLSGAANTGLYNTFVGYLSGNVNSTGTVNTFLGYNAGGLNTTGQNNTFLGGRAGYYNVSTHNNTFVGTEAGVAATGSDNSFFGYNSGSNFVTGSRNTFIGMSTSHNFKGGANNVALGYGAECGNNTNTSTAIGSSSLVDASNATALGAGATASAGNATAIGAGAVANQINTVILGSSTNIGVGIGTSAPENSEGWDRVTETRGTANSKMLVSTATGSIYSGLWSHSTGYFGAPAGGMTGTWSNHPFSIITNKTTKMMVDASGKVGVGTTAPLARLHARSGVENLQALITTYTGTTAYSYANMFEVTGNLINALTVTKAGATAFNVAGSGDVWSATGVYASSDLRLKKDLVQIESPLAKLSQLKGYEYYWNDIARNKIGLPESKQIGLIAQDVEKVVPQAVTVFNQDGYKAVDYTKIIPLLVEGINAQQKQIEQLQATIRDLKQSGAQPLGNADVLKDKAQLYPNVPNPFSSNTEIRYVLPETVTDAQILVFDMNGRQIKSMPVKAGNGSVTIKGSELAKGMYFYTLIANGQEIDTKRMILTEAN